MFIHNEELLMDLKPFPPNPAMATMLLPLMEQELSIVLALLCVRHNLPLRQAQTAAMMLATDALNRFELLNAIHVQLMNNAGASDLIEHGLGEYYARHTKAVALRPIRFEPTGDPLTDLAMIKAQLMRGRIRCDNLLRIAEPELFCLLDVMRERYQDAIKRICAASETVDHMICEQQLCDCNPNIDICRLT